MIKVNWILRIRQGNLDHTIGLRRNADRLQSSDFDIELVCRKPHGIDGNRVADLCLLQTGHQRGWNRHHIGIQNFRAAFDAGHDPAFFNRFRHFAWQLAFNLNDRHFINHRAPEIGTRHRRPQLGDFVELGGVQPQFQFFIFIAQIHIQQNVPHRPGTGLGDFETVQPVAEFMQHPHGIAQQRLGVEVGVNMIFVLAMCRHQITQIERKRWSAIAGRVALTRNFIIGQGGVFQNFHEIEVHMTFRDARHLHVGRCQRYFHRSLHLVEQERPQGAADGGYGGGTSH